MIRSLTQRAFIAGLNLGLVLLVAHFVLIIHNNILLGISLEETSAGQYIISEIHTSSKEALSSLQVGDRVIEINGKRPGDIKEVQRYGSVARIGTISIIRYPEQGAPFHMTYRNENRPSAYQTFTHLVVPGCTFLIMLLLSLILYRKNANDPASALLIFFFLMIGTGYLAGYASSSQDTTGRLVLMCSLPLIPVVFLHFLKMYLMRFSITLLSGRVLSVLYFLALAANALMAASIMGNTWSYFSYSLTRLLTISFFIFGVFFDIFKLIQCYLKFRNVEISSLFKIMLLGQITSFSPFILLTLLPQLFGRAIVSFEISTMFLIMLPITYVYLLTANQLFDVDFIVSRFKYYLSIALFPAGLIVAVLAMIQNRDEYPWIRWIQMFLVVYLFIIVFLFFKEKLDYFFRNILDRKPLDYQDSLERFAKRIGSIMKHSDLENVLQREISELLSVSRVEFLTLPERPEEGSSPHEAAELLYHLPNLPNIGEAIQMNKGVMLVLGNHRGQFYILWISHKKNHTRFNRDEMNWLNTISNYSSIVCENLYFIEGLVEDLESEMNKRKGSSSWVSRLIFNLAENERRKLAADLHDSALQDQLVWLRRLENLLLEFSFSVEVKQELLAIKEGLLDVIYQIRETCNELRPPLLREMGIVKALENLFEYAQLQSNFTIEFNTRPVEELEDELVITLYRITQELLRNASKHSGASQIIITLEQKEAIHFTYKDNGIGMDIINMQESFLHMGLSGIKERVVSLEGECEFFSEKGTGFKVFVTLPLTASMGIQSGRKEEDDSYFAS